MLVNTLEGKTKPNERVLNKILNLGIRKYDSDKMKGSIFKSKQTSNKNSHGKQTKLFHEKLSKSIIFMIKILGVKLSALYGLEMKDTQNLGTGMKSVKQDLLKPCTKRGSFRPTETMSMMDVSMVEGENNSPEKEIRLISNVPTDVNDEPQNLKIGIV